MQQDSIQTLSPPYVPRHSLIDELRSGVAGSPLHGSSDGSSACGLGLGNANNARAGSTSASPLTIASPVRSDGRTAARPATVAGRAAVMAPSSAVFARRSPM